MKKKLMLLFAWFAIVFATIFINSKIVSKHKILSTIKAEEPNGIYGPSEAEIVLKIGNGGAGPTCLLQALSEDYIKSKNLNIRIAWVQTISRLTLENLKEGTIDISLSYESESELQAIQEGWASNRTLIFNDHFLIVGPKNNPAGILPNDTASTAFRKTLVNRQKIFWNILNHRERKL
jgi:ABC-type tungstate transport system permease subunit